MTFRARVGAVALVAAGWIGGAWVAALASQAPAQPSATAAAERKAWYFYTVKWGKQDRFLELFQKNHYPVLKAQLGGRLTSVRTYVPTYHGDGRADWTFAVEITFKDAAAMTGPSGEAEIARKLFPNHALFTAEERERFELLDAHWDVPLNEIDMNTRKGDAR